MRQKGFLHFLRAKSCRLLSMHKKAMVTFLLSAPSVKQLKAAREHLRYWPFVKAFQPVDDTHIRVQVFVGTGIANSLWDYYVVRSSELMNQCVRQYQAIFVLSQAHTSPCLCWYHRNAFLRPDDLLKPFCDFIDEVSNT